MPYDGDMREWWPPKRESRYEQQSFWPAGDWLLFWMMVSAELSIACASMAWGKRE